MLQITNSLLLTSKYCLQDLRKTSRSYSEKNKDRYFSKFPSSESPPKELTSFGIHLYLIWVVIRHLIFETQNLCFIGIAENQIKLFHHEINHLSTRQTKTLQYNFLES
jgi:hypothetical protein